MRKKFNEIAEEYNLTGVNKIVFFIISYCIAPVAWVIGFVEVIFGLS